MDYSESTPGAQLPHPSNYNSREQIALASLKSPLESSHRSPPLLPLLSISYLAGHVSLSSTKKALAQYQENYYCQFFGQGPDSERLNALSKPTMSNSQLSLLTANPKIFLSHVKHKERLSMWSLWSD